MVNADTIEAWNTVLFDKFVRYRDVLVDGLARHGDRALARNPPRPGARVVDLGCGFGDTTAALARLVGPSGHVVGIDAAPRFIAAARSELTAVSNATFVVADIEQQIPGGPFDLAFSRMGTMFCDRPVIALRNIRKALAPRGRLCMVVWRNKDANEGMTVAENIARAHLGQPEKGAELTCGPGPFSMANADVVGDQLVAAGFTDIAFERSDAELSIGTDLEAAVAFALDIGPAGELMRLAGDAAIAKRRELETAMRDGLQRFVRPDGVRARTSTWIVTAAAD